MYEVLINRLRNYEYWKESERQYVHPPIVDNAADAIEQKGKENAELRAELEQLKKSLSGRYRFLENERLRNELEAVKRENERLHKENFWLNSVEGGLSDV